MEHDEVVDMAEEDMLTDLGVEDTDKTGMLMGQEGMDKVKQTDMQQVDVDRVLVEDDRQQEVVDKRGLHSYKAPKPVEEPSTQILEEIDVMQHKVEHCLYMASAMKQDYAFTIVHYPRTDNTGT